jgi:hypothetical protein
MSYIGTVTHGVVVLPADAKLEEGTQVRVEPVAEEPKVQTLGQRLMKFAGIAKGLPSDMARNHDHYLHGRPKK